MDYRKLQDMNRHLIISTLLLSLAGLALFLDLSPYVTLAAFVVIWAVVTFRIFKVGYYSEVGYDEVQRDTVIRVVFDGPPGPVCGRFVEVELPNGTGIDIGKWIECEDGMWALEMRVPKEDVRS